MSTMFGSIHHHAKSLACHFTDVGPLQWNLLDDSTGATEHGQADGKLGASISILKRSFALCGLQCRVPFQWVACACDGAIPGSI